MHTTLRDTCISGNAMSLRIETMTYWMRKRLPNITKNLENKTDNTFFDYQLLENINEFMYITVSYRIVGKGYRCTPTIWRKPCWNRGEMWKLLSFFLKYSVIKLPK